LAEQVFEDILPEDLSVSQLPQRFVVGDRVLKVEGSAVRDKDNAVTGMLYSVSDISDLEAAQRESNANRMLITLVKEMDAFVAFIEDTKDLLQNSAQAMKKADRGAVRRNLHTIKGNSYSFGLTDIGHLVHQIEEEKTISIVSLQRIEQSFRDFLDRNHKILELRFDDSEKQAYEVSTDQVSRLHTLVSEVKGSQQGPLHKWLAEITQKQATVLLGPVSEFSHKLASRLGKKIEFEFEGAQVLLDYDSMKPVCQSLIHLIRNSIDHGIERTEERGSKGQVGKLRLAVKDEQNEYIIEVSDDGRGIDTDRLLDSALRKKIVTPEKAARMTHSEKLNLIFAEGLSSAEQVTDISGRGMGMSAVLEPVTALGGRIEIQSELSSGTKFTVHVPKSRLDLQVKPRLQRSSA
jgi:two-component system chemotaxis sensor kinase CheA